MRNALTLSAEFIAFALFSAGITGAVACFF